MLISPSQVGKLAQGAWASGGRAGVFPPHLRCYAPSPSETSGGLPAPSYRPGGLCSGGRDLPQSPSHAGARPVVQVSGFTYRYGRPGKADGVGGSKEGRSGEMGGVPGGDEGAALGRHSSQLGSEGGQGGQEERGGPPPTQPCTSARRKGLLTTATSEQGTVGCKRERDKGVSGERLGGQAAVWRGDRGLPAGPKCQPTSRVRAL